MKRLILLFIILSASIQVEAAKMSSYTNNTTPNEDVYFIGVDPNDTTQTANGSNYRYSLSSILGSGLLDFNVNSLTVSGTGDSWLELENNTSFTDSLTGKYGIRFYNGVLQQIINGTASAIGSGGSAPTLQADDPDMSDATGWYLATGSGDLFYVNSGIGMWTFTGTYSGDVTDPVIGAVTPSALTHDGTGATLTATIASITEVNEDYRQWSLYDVTDAAIKTDWTTFTGLSISGITIPADQHTYRIDVRVYDLAGNVGTASSSNIVYSGGASALFDWNCNTTAVQTPTATATLSNGAEIISTGGIDNSGFVRTTADYHGYAGVALGTVNLNEQVGRIEFSYRMPAAASGNPNIIKFTGQTGSFYVVGGHGLIQFQYGTDSIVLGPVDGVPSDYFTDTWRSGYVWWDATANTHGIVFGAYSRTESCTAEITGGATVIQISGSDSGTSYSDTDEVKIYDTTTP